MQNLQHHYGLIKLKSQFSKISRAFFGRSKFEKHWFKIHFDGFCMLTLIVVIIVFIFDLMIWEWYLKYFQC